MDIEGNPVLHQKSAKSFVNLCIEKFGWRDLSSDIVMDVGCGLEGFCGMAILDKFPDVRTIFGMDNNPEAVTNFRPRASSKMGCEFADIEIRETLQHFEGRMTKVVSTHVFHLLVRKEEAFRNVFHLLKPDGEAAVLFVVTALIDEWLKEMLKVPKWKEAYQGLHGEDSPKKGAAEYRAMVEHVGFRVIECEETKKKITYPSRQHCKETLYRMCGSDFNIPSSLLQEFKEESVKVLLKLSLKDAKGRPCYTQTELHLLLQKPA